MAETLFTQHFRFDAADHCWPDRDRLLVDESAVVLAETVAALVGTDAAFATRLPGAVGQTLGIASGMALTERMLAARYGRSLVDHRTWVFVQADELAAGAAFEAASVAGDLLLSRLTVIAATDAEGAMSLRRFAALGWSVRLADADDPAGEAALSAALRSRKPTLILCGGANDGARTRWADRSSAMAGERWLAAGRRGAGARRAWLKRLRRHGSRAAFEQVPGAHALSRWPAALALDGHARAPAAASPGRWHSTAGAVRLAMARLADATRAGVGIPEPAGLPVEDACGMTAVLPGQYGGRSVPWGTRIQAAAAGLNGMALHGGVLPVGRFLLGDAEAARPSLRLAAQLGLRVVHVLIEPDAACPVGGLRAGWRAMQNLHVHRPANGAEAWACGELALRRAAGPSVLLLSESEPEPEDAAEISHDPLLAVLRGGYVAREPPAARQVTLLASGPELAVALAVQARLRAAGLAVAVVSLPCWDLFQAQTAECREAVLGSAPRIAVEAGGGFGWERWIGTDGLFLGCRADGRAALIEEVEAAVRRHLDGPTAHGRPDNSARLLGTAAEIR